MWRRLCIFVGVIILLVTMVSAPSSRIHAQGNPVPNVDGWCRAYGFNGGAFYYNGIWHCVKDGIAYDISDMNAVCMWSFGDGYPIAIFDNSDPFPWRCAPNLPKYPDAQESHTVNGVAVFGIKVQIYCEEKGWGGNITEPANPNDWKCENDQPVNFAVACPEVWGNARPVAFLADPYDKYGWRCIPQSTPQPVSPAPCVGQLGITIHQWAWVRHDIGNRLRKYPAGKLITIVPNGSAVYVIGGPVCRRGLVWFHVVYGNIKGWMAEGNASEVWLTPW